jgi:cytochrome P450
MLPNKSAQQVADVNAVTAEVIPVVERRLRHIAALSTLSALTDEDNLAVYAANLIGLLIQSHDAGRGLLGNALLHALAHPGNGKQYWEQLVVETLRFDPAIQNTRRVLTEDLHVDGKLLQAGETVLVVLAAANRDPSVFAHPAQFDVERGNNDDHLTFGAGMHQCAANHFSMALAADALSALFDDGSCRIELLQPDIAYEPLVNTRLPKQILLRLHRPS